MTAPPDPDDDSAAPDEETSPPPDPGPDPAMRAALMSVFGFGLLFALIGFAFFGAREGVGVLVGGVIATANLYVFARVSEAFVSQRGSSAPWAVIALLKLVLLFGGLLLVLRSGVMSGVSLAAGYAALPFGITFASLFGPGPSDGDLPPTHSTRRGGNVIKPRR
jgi:hypothetical protein